MIAYVSNQGRGVIDTLLEAVSQRLRAKDITLFGAVQINSERAGATVCDMDLNLLFSGETIRISQDLGPLSSGCRLDPDGMARAVLAVEQALENTTSVCTPSVLIVNKFGKQELEGRGFRDAISLALGKDIPVLVGVGPSHLDGFMTFCDGMAQPVEAETCAIESWLSTVKTGA